MGIILSLILMAVGAILTWGVNSSGGSINIDVVDLRTVRPMDVEAIARSVQKTNRAVVLEEGWEVCGMGAQVVDFIQRECFDDLDAPVLRVHQEDVPMPYAKNLERAAKPDAGKILVTSKEYPVVVDVLVFKKDFLQKNPKIVKATVDSFFEALDMIKREPDKAYELMGSVVKQPGDAFAKSAAYIAWQDRAANKAYYAKDHKQFVDFAVRVLKSTRVIEKEPKAEEMVDLRFQ